MPETGFYAGAVIRRMAEITGKLYSGHIRKAAPKLMPVVSNVIISELMRMNDKRKIIVMAVFLLFTAMTGAQGEGDYKNSPHGLPLTGILRTSEYPRGSCGQCHQAHDESGAMPFGLFQENSNRLCFSQSMGGCHADRPPAELRDIRRRRRTGCLLALWIQGISSSTAGE